MFQNHLHRLNVEQEIHSQGFGVLTSFVALLERFYSDTSAWDSRAPSTEVGINNNRDIPAVWVPSNSKLICIIEIEMQVFIRYDTRKNILTILVKDGQICLGGMCLPEFA